MSDPKDAGPKPPFASGAQSGPGSEAALRPRADHGETSYRGHDRLTGKIALVTGGDSGIGRAVALAFAREGADVAISYLEEQRDADESRRLVEEAGRRCVLIRGDLTSDAHCAEVVRKTVGAFGRVDILVNNAAYQGKSVGRFE